MSTADIRVSFGLLGPLLVIDLNGMAISIPQAKQRVIMAALLLSANATVSSTQLVNALWENEPPPSGMAAIRTYVARLRRTLGGVGARLVSRPAGYAVEVRGAAEFDLGTLEQLRLELRGAADSRLWERVALISGRALDLWRGTPLEDIPSPSLRRTATEGLEELRIELITTRIDAELCLGQDRHVVAELRQLASEHPLREHIQAQLALSYYRCGRQFEALNVYQKARASLVGELGIEPGPELRELHQRILTADPVLDSAYALPNAFTGMPARRRLRRYVVLRIQDSPGVGTINQVSAVGRADPAQHLRHVLGNCVLADVQGLTDLNVRKTDRDKVQYAHLAPREFGCGC